MIRTTVQKLKDIKFEKLIDAYDEIFNEVLAFNNNLLEGELDLLVSLRLEITKRLSLQKEKKDNEYIDLLELEDLRAMEEEEICITA